jgi:hypothetical protein
VSLLRLASGVVGRNVVKQGLDDYKTDRGLGIGQLPQRDDGIVMQMLLLLSAGWNRKATGSEILAQTESFCNTSSHAVQIGPFAE